MCGIVGYIGSKPATPILLSGLQALEYRGYDSAGVALQRAGDLVVIRTVGRVATLAKSLATANRRTLVATSQVGIAHTRWATHGEPSVANAHPHSDCSGQVAVVHNGIIENYQELKIELEQLGHIFSSVTDTEVIAHLLEELLKTEPDVQQALALLVGRLQGAYALVIILASQPDTVYAVKYFSPLVVGIGVGEHLVASDPAALVGHTKQLVYLSDKEIAVLRADSLQVVTFEQVGVQPAVEHLEWDVEQVRKGTFAHFMRKEIQDSPETVRSALRGRLRVSQKLIKLGGLEQVQDQLQQAERIVLIGCGTSSYAGMVGEYLIEEFAQIPTELHLASEFRYRDQPFGPRTICIAISQSGETADTLAAVKHAQAQGLLTLGIVNVVGSSIARATQAGVYNHAGPEVSVASTKAFVSQLTVLSLIALYLAQLRNRPVAPTVLQHLQSIPDQIEIILKQSKLVEKVAQHYAQYDNFLFIGRTHQYPVALEGALKLKEITYLHAEGCAAGELKHGPIAMIDSKFPTVALVPKNLVTAKLYSNLEEIKARKGPILAIATQGDTRITQLANDAIFVPQTLASLQPLLTVIPLQLLAYYIGVARGLDVDKPRNLAKSVTVE